MAAVVAGVVCKEPAGKMPTAGPADSMERRGSVPPPARRASGWDPAGSALAAVPLASRLRWLRFH